METKIPTLYKTVPVIAKELKISKSHVRYILDRHLEMFPSYTKHERKRVAIEDFEKFKQVYEIRKHCRGSLIDAIFDKPKTLWKFMELVSEVKS